MASTAITAISATAPAMSAMVVRRLSLPALVGAGGVGCGGGADLAGAGDSAFRVIGWAGTGLGACSVAGRVGLGAGRAMGSVIASRAASANSTVVA